MLTANYVADAIDDPIAGFPAATAAIAAAFPDRFTRDASGQSAADRHAAGQFRADRAVGAALGHQFLDAAQVEGAARAGGVPRGHRAEPVRGAAPAGRRGARRRGRCARAAGTVRAAMVRAAAVTAGAAGSAVAAAASAVAAVGGGGGGQGGGRMQFALYHTWHFTDRVLVAEAARARPAPRRRDRRRAAAAAARAGGAGGLYQQRARRAAVGQLSQRDAGQRRHGGGADDARLRRARDREPAAVRRSGRAARLGAARIRGCAARGVTLSGSTTCSTRASG